MSSIAWALGWQFLNRHRLAFGSAITCMAAIAVFVQTWSPESMPVGLAVLLMCVPVTQLTYLIAIFAFGSDNDLLSCESTYPTHMLRLPVASRQLVAWPWLFGVTCIGGFWAGVCWLVMFPLTRAVTATQFGMPVWTTPLVCIATLSWLQAVLWANYKRPLFRSVTTAAALAIPLFFAVGVFGGSFDERQTCWWLGASSVLALGFSVNNLSSARRGAPSGWLIPDRPTLRKPRYLERWTDREPSGTRLTTVQLDVQPDNRTALPIPAERLQPEHAYDSSPRWTSVQGWRLKAQQWMFAGGLQSQIWYEWQCYCVPLTLVIFAAIGLVLWLSVSFHMIRSVRVAILFVPLFVSAICGIGMGGLNHHVGDRHVSVFFASRPLTSVQFVVAKWVAAALTAMVVCVAAIVTFTLANYWCDDQLLWTETWDRCRALFPTSQLVYSLGVASLAYWFATWVLLVQVLPVKLSGRHWLQTLVIAVLSGFGFLIVLSTSIENKQLLPWVIGGLFLVKAVAAIVTLPKIWNQEIVAQGTLVQLFCAWGLLGCLFAVTIFGLTFQVNPALGLVAVPFVLLLMPMSRLALAPLALHWNRHR